VRQARANSATVDRERLGRQLESERAAYRSDHRRSWKLFEQASEVLLDGVPMTWMTKWPGGFPIFFDRARDNRLIDVDGREYLDFCLGDSAAIAGHGSTRVAGTIGERYARGATAMLPTEDAIWVGRELRRRFGLDRWLFTTSATDANRTALRMARQATGRQKVLVFNGCYHGTVDEAVVALDDAGRPRARPGNVGPAVDPTITTKVIEFNDIDALAHALRPRDVACVLAEPVMTNVGMVQPQPGYHEVLRDVTRTTGTWLVLDETQTWAAGPGGCTQAMGLEPDAVTLGKGMAGGIAIGTLGLRRELGDAVAHAGVDLEDGGSVGGTLAANALSLAAARTTLGEVLTDQAFAGMVGLAERYVTEMQATFAARAMPWHMTNVGARAEYRFCPLPPRTGAESARAADEELDQYLHLALLNRGFLQTPFHNMALMGPTTTTQDMTALVSAIGAALDELLVAS